MSTDAEYRCIVGNLSYFTKDRELHDAFNKFGHVVDAKVVLYKGRKNSREFGFVTFDENAAMENAIDSMHGSDLDGNCIIVEKAFPNEDGDYYIDRPLGSREYGSKVSNTTDDTNYRCFIENTLTDINVPGLQHNLRRFGQFADAKVLENKFFGHPGGFVVLTYEEKAAMDKVINAVNRRASLFGQDCRAGKVQDCYVSDKVWSCTGPAILISHGERDNLLTLYDVSEGQHCTRVSKDFANNVISGSCGQWFLLLDDHGPFEVKHFIVNWVTKEKIQLPSVDHDDMEYYFSFLLSGSPGADAGCTVYLVGPSKITYCKLDANTFSSRALQSEEGHELNVTDATIFQGRLHFICHDGLYYSNLEDPLPLMQTKCIDDRLNELKGYFPRLVGSRDKLWCLYGFSPDDYEAPFEILEADFIGNVWKEVDSIGGECAIFIDKYSSFSFHVTPGCGLQGNSVYFIPRHSDEHIATYEHPLRLTYYRTILEEVRGTYHQPETMVYDIRNRFIVMSPSSAFEISGRDVRYRPHQLRWVHGSGDIGCSTNV